MTQRVTTLEEFSFVFQGTVIKFIKLYHDCWICSLPEITAHKLKIKMEIQNISIDELGLSCRATNVLKHEGIFEIAELLTRTPEELLKFENCGKRTVWEIQNAVEEKGLKLMRPYANNK
jgi:DNA-directed RNA polymerase alpha subunit